MRGLPHASSHPTATPPPTPPPAPPNGEARSVHPPHHRLVSCTESAASAAHLLLSPTFPFYCSRDYDFSLSRTSPSPELPLVADRE